MGDVAIIRPVVAGDEPRLALIGAATFLETFAGGIAGDALMAHCQKQHAAETYHGYLLDGARGWLAELGGAPVGYALLASPEVDAARSADLELKRIYVLSRFHGGGVAARLLEAVIAAAAGCDRLLLGVKADNARAIAFYRKQQFQQIATRRFDVGGTLYDDVVMARSINEKTI